MRSGSRLFDAGELAPDVLSFRFWTKKSQREKKGFSLVRDVTRDTGNFVSYEVVEKGRFEFRYVKVIWQYLKIIGENIICKGNLLILEVHWSSNFTVLWINRFIEKLKKVKINFCFSGSWPGGTWGGSIWRQGVFNLFIKIKKIDPPELFQLILILHFPFFSFNQGTRSSDLIGDLRDLPPVEIIYLSNL